AVQDAARKVPFRISQLPGDEAGGLPAAIGEQYRRHGHAEPPPVDGCGWFNPRRVAPQGPATDHQRRDGADLQNHENVLCRAARTNTAAVDSREHSDGCGSDESFAAVQTRQLEKIL